MIPLSIIRRVGRLPALERTEPGMFALGNPGRLTGCFTATGFHDVAAHMVAATRRYPLPADAVQQLAATQLAIRSLLAQLPDADRARALHEIERALDAFVDQEGVALSVEIIIGVGTK
jgi:hypothetical protein